MRISDWSSDVCSSDLRRPRSRPARHRARRPAGGGSSPAGGVADPAFWILPRPPPPRPYNRAANQQRRQSSRPDQREDPSVDKERFELGLKQRKATLGDAYVSKALAQADDFSRPFQEAMTEWCWGFGWVDPALPPKPRRRMHPPIQ